ncbi:serine/threonine-protein kinase EDR1 isoform X1 [Brachypodium distachyon]|uniref:serine/threonine-protein kinase EDR1 isoform X1 n=1 Tax=Brachypodium distachyon TaxID=15368 RepID=UPI00071CA2F3|nr:serine/threonine-protein kinase EDR1 isoform X1 [Brachypodium distachyon]|eukprot:XP_014756709.1 serine/threonine-protein kinase EDR1 isoform X1 [Brachypodium distachyon]
MDDLPDDREQSDTQSSDPNCLPSREEHKFQSISLAKQENNLDSADSSLDCREVDRSLCASQALWSTGSLSSPIPNGFYSIIPDKKLKECFDTIPSPEDLYSLGIEGFKAEIILVDLMKDKKLSAIKQLCVALVKGLNSNPAAMIKKVAGLVCDFYKRSNPQLSPARTSSEEISHFMENRGVQLLGQIRHGSCRPRAILFKVLADSVGIDSKLVVGIPNEESHEYDDSPKHMSVVVMLKSVEFLVDLMRFPGQLVPFSSKAIITSHISAAGESDSADYDSCDSPLEPNSPLCSQRQEQDDNSRSFKVPSLRNIMLRSTNSMEGKLRCSSHSEPNVANAFCGRSRRKVVNEHQRTASSSPEHPMSRAHGRSMLGDRQYGDGVAVSRYLNGASTSNARIGRRRSISIAPEIGDDFARAVKAMSESMRQNRLSRAHNDGSPGHSNDSERNESLGDFNGNEVSARESNVQEGPRRQISSQRALSLPSSPHRLGSHASDLREPADFLTAADLMSTWNKVLQSSPFLNKPLLPFEEWHIEFSEITVGTRVGIGFFGEVFRGVWNGTDVAIKVFLEQDLTMENMEDFCNEISILSRLRHPNVILFLGACMKPPHLSLVTEYMEMGSLYYLIHTSGNKGKLSWRRKLKMLRDICRGLMCMHRLKIVHRDLKSANCLVNKYWTVKLCDFGLSRVMLDSAMRDNSSAGTPEWMAPELIRNEPFTEKCDIFSLGVIMWELCTLSRPWAGKPPVQVVYSVANEGARLEIPDGPLRSLISDCWAEPDKRPSCQEILTRLLDCEYTLC